MGENRKYERKVVQTVRGTERIVISKMEKSGWEFVDQTPGTVRTSLKFRRAKKRLPGIWALAAVAALVLVVAVIGVGAMLENDEKGSADAGTPAAVESSSEAPSPKTSSEPGTAPAGPTIVIECFTPDFENSIEFTIGRRNPDFREAWSTAIPIDKKYGTQHCQDAEADEYGDGPALKPITRAEKAIWKRHRDVGNGGPDRSTLAIPYYQCVQHDSPEYLNSYPDAPNLASEAETMLLLCPDHPNAAAIRKRIRIQNGFGEQIVNGETITDGTWRIGQDRIPGKYRTRAAGGSLTCYWARKSADGTPIASGSVENNEEPRPLTVTIAPTDYEFYTENCGVWFRIN